MRIGEPVQVHVHQRQTYHVGRDVVAPEVLGQAPLFVGRQRAMTLDVGVGFEDVLVGRDQKPSGTAGRVKHGLGLLWVNDLNHEINDVARGTELPGVALRAEHGEQVLKGITQAFAVVVVELVDDLEEHLERFGVPIGQIGVLEDVAEERRNAGVLRHLGDGFGVEVQDLEAAEAGVHQVGPTVADKLIGEELALAAQLFALGIHVVHELVDQRDGDLLDLTLRVGHLAHKDVASRVNAPFGVSIKHGLSFDF